MIQLLLSQAANSLEKYLPNFNLHTWSLLHVFPPIRILMSQEEQLPIFESEPELNGSRQARPSTLSSQVKVRRFFQNNLTGSQYGCRHADSYPTLRYNPEGFWGSLTRTTRSIRRCRPARVSQVAKLEFAPAGESIYHRRFDRWLPDEQFPSQCFPDAGSGWSTPQRSGRSFQAIQSGRESLHSEACS